MNKGILIYLKENKLFVALLVFTIGFTYANFAERYSFFILSIFLLIAMGALYGLFFSVDKKAISVNKTFCLFYYFFFSLAPIVQYKYNTTFYFTGFINNKTYINAGVLVLASLVFYLITYGKITRWFLCKKVAEKEDLEKNKINHSTLLKTNYLLAVLSIGFYLYLIKFNWDLLIFRPFTFNLKENTNLGLIGYSLLTIIKLVPFVILINYAISGYKYNIHSLFFFLCMLVTCFPTALSRGILAIVYIPMLVIYIPNLKKNKYYIGMYCSLILLIFPLFNMFRDVKKEGLVLKYELFNSAHFDAFHNYALLLREKIITHGEQLLTSVLFFVQENVWLNKPPGTGHLLAEKLNFNYFNIAMPLLGEGYANFGYFGVLIFVFIIVLINVFLDQGNLKKNWMKIYFYVFLGYEFYLLRGDLWSSIKIISSISIAIFWVFLCYSMLRKVVKE